MECELDVNPARLKAGRTLAQKVGGMPIRMMDEKPAW